MTFVFFLIGLVAAYFTWKKLSSYYLERGKNRFVAHLAGLSSGFFVWSVMLIIGVALFETDVKQNDQIEEKVKQEVPEKSDDIIQFESDQAALKKYLNTVNAETIFVDQIIQEMGSHLTNGDIYSASASALQCVEASDRLQYNLSVGDLKTIELENDVESDNLEKAIESLSFAYYTKKDYCETIKDFLDTGKPSLVAESKQKMNSAEMSTIEAVGGMMSVALSYKIAYIDNEWKLDDQNKTK